MDTLGAQQPQSPIPEDESNRTLAERRGGGHYPGGPPPAPIPQHVPEPAAPAPVASPGLDHLADLPDIGDMVIYRPRSGEIRRGRDRVPAMVIWRNVEARTLDLVVSYDANDHSDRERVPEWDGVPGNLGWQTKHGPAVVVGGPRMSDGDDVANLAGDLLSLREMVQGSFDQPKSCILEMLDNLDTRLDALEGPQGGASAANKRKAAGKAKAKGAKKR